MLNSFQRAKISALLPEIAQRTGIPYPKLAELLCGEPVTINPFVCEDEPQDRYLTEFTEDCFCDEHGRRY